MIPQFGILRFDPLHIFAVSIAAFLGATLFLLAILSRVSLETSLFRAVIGWLVLSLLGIALAQLVRWVLAVPPPSTQVVSRLDITLPSTDANGTAG